MSEFVEGATAADLPLDGKRVLVLEDEPLISMMTEDMVVDLGGIVVGPYASLDALSAALDDGLDFDVALLDVNVNGTRSTSVAPAIAARGKPIVFCSGYDETGIEAEWRATPRLRKPFSEKDLAVMIGEVLGG